MDNGLNTYFKELKKFSMNTKNDIRLAWQYIIKKFNLSKNDATEIIHLYLREYFKQHNNNEGLTM